MPSIIDFYQFVDKDTLTLSNRYLNSLSDDDWAVLCDFLTKHSEITVLDLHRHDFDTRCIQSVRFIADMLKQNTTLTSINLSDNFITINGIQSIADALKQNTTLTSIDLSDNDIDTDGMQSIVDMLKQNTTLTSI